LLLLLLLVLPLIVHMFRVSGSGHVSQAAQRSEGL
jgi:hypothetical protein